MFRSFAMKLAWCALGCTALARADALPVDQLKKSLAVIKSAEGHGTGWVATADGKILTNFHVVESTVRDGGELTVEFREAGRSAVKADIWQIWPQYDLAVLYIPSQMPPPPSKDDKDKKAPASKQPAPLPMLNLAPVDPEATSTVFVMGYPLQADVGMSVTKGSVTALRNREEIDLLGATKRYADDCRWVQIDAAIDGGNSGGPILNDKGQVVGVATMARVDAQAMNFAIAPSVVRKCLTGLLKEPVTLKNLQVFTPPVIDLQAVPERYRDRVAAESERPELIIADVSPLDLPQNMKSAGVLSAARDLQKAIEANCPKPNCNDGRVKVTKTRTVGTGMNAKTETHTVTEVCKTCKGTGRREIGGEQRWRLLERVVKSLGQLEPPDEKNIDARSQAIRESMQALQRVNWVEDEIRTRALTRLNMDNPAGQIVCGYGWVVQDTTLNNVRRFVVKLYDQNIYVVVEQAISESRVENPYYAFFCGIVVSHTSVGDSRVVVLARGFVRAD
jgi:S1-C subfamily serine protease